LSTTLHNYFACLRMFYSSAIILRMKYTKELYRINCIVCVTSGDAFIFEHLFFIYPALLAAKPPVFGSFTVHTIRIFSFLSEFATSKQVSILRNGILRNPRCSFQLTDPVNRDHRRAQLHAGIKGLQSLRSSLERDTRQTIRGCLHPFMS